MNDAARFGIEHACERLIKRFVQLNDAHDHDALAEMFVSEGSFARPTDPTNPVTGREDIRAFFRDRPKRITRHVMTNIVVEVLDENAACARSYVVLYSGEKGAQVLLGDFDDTFRRDDDGAWKFQSRAGSLAFG